MITPTIAVFQGGVSRERPVSMRSGAAAAGALARSFPVEVFTVDARELPCGIDPRRHVVFSTLHGVFGEDGGMQGLLDAAGVDYAGFGAEASARAMDKQRTKELAAAAGVRVAPGVAFSAARPPTAEDLVRDLGLDLVFKPRGEGSSVGLRITSGLEQAAAALADLDAAADWVCETRVKGRELTVGILEGRALPPVEIRPASGTYDYASKYTLGATDYLCPAPLAPRVSRAVQDAAETAFAACDGRDYARVDFILPDACEPVLLEVNSLPGLTETSLLPMAARAAGLDFPALLAAMAAPAIRRFTARRQLQP